MWITIWSTAWPLAATPKPATPIRAIKKRKKYLFIISPLNIVMFTIDNCRFEASIPPARRLAQLPKNVHRRRDSLFRSEVTVPVRAWPLREPGRRKEYDNLGRWGL